MKTTRKPSVICRTLWQLVKPQLPSDIQVNVNVKPQQERASVSAYANGRKIGTYSTGGCVRPLHTVRR